MNLALGSETQYHHISQDLRGKRDDLEEGYGLGSANGSFSFLHPTNL
jgi:hypothetical protein